MKFLDNSAWFLLEKLKNQVILTKNHNIKPKIKKIPHKILKISKNPWIPKVPRWRPRWRPMWRTYVEDLAELGKLMNVALSVLLRKYDNGVSDGGGKTG